MDVTSILNSTPVFFVVEILLHRVVVRFLVPPRGDPKLPDTPQAAPAANICCRMTGF